MKGRRIMATNKKKRSAREKRILIASLVIAATIVAGSTFAWFSSKDEVTNRLSANSSYNVAIGETFEPPENWAPGQTVDKDAYAVNTGNVGAIARMWVDGSLRVMNYSNAANTMSYTVNEGVGSFAVGDLKDVVNSNLVAAGFTKMSADGKSYFRTLSTAQTTRDNAFQTTNQQGYPDDIGVALSEVQAMHSGILAYAPSNAEYTFVTNQPTTLKIKIENDTYQNVLVPKGVLVHVGGTAGTGATIDEDTGEITSYGQEKPKTLLNKEGTTEYNTVYVQAQDSNDAVTATFAEHFQPVPVEYETFTPLTDGLFLFLRNEVFDVNEGEARAPEFSGYYRNTPSNSDPVYYALNGAKTTNRSEFTVPANSVTVAYASENESNDFYVVPTANLKLLGANYTELDADSMKYFTNADGSIVYAVYDADNVDTFDPATDIYVEVNIANLTDDSTANPPVKAKWQAVGIGDNKSFTGVNGIKKDASKLTYYYKGVIEPGTTSEKLVDSVKLGELTTNEAFLAMDFDLNVHLESMQVTVDADGNEMLTDNAWAATGVENTGATGVATQDTSAPKKITNITWTAQ